MSEVRNLATILVSLPEQNALPHFAMLAMYAAGQQAQDRATRQATRNCSPLRRIPLGVSTLRGSIRQFKQGPGC